MSSEVVKRTPLYPCHLQLGARMVPFAGYEMPVQYSSVLEETKAVRKTCGLFDVSHMGQFTLDGPDALKALQPLVTNNLEKVAPGQAQYNLLCNEAGGTIDDLIVYNRSETQTFLCVNASNIEKDFDWIKTHLKGDSVLKNISDETALIALQGPEAENILTKICDPNTVRELKYYWAIDTKVFDFPCYLSRTGYTGEDGFELYVAAEVSADLWNKLLEIGKPHGLLPCGLGARDTLRLEAGYPLYGHELGEEMSPLWAKLGWVIKLNKETFIGQDALKTEKEKGLSKSLKALLIKDRRIARQNYPICDESGNPIGQIASGTFSPHLNAPIALGLVDKDFAHLKTYFIEVRKTLIPAEEVSLPFVENHTRRGK